MAQDSVMRHRPFALFWTARVMSSVAFQMMSVAIGWQVYSITHSAYALGLVGLAQFLPMFVLTLVVGHVADRYDRRTIAYVCQSIEGIAALVLCLGAWHGWHDVAPIYAIAAITGAARAFESPSMAALLPNLVARNQLQHASAWSTSANQTAQILGPAMGGVLYGLGALTVFGAVTVAFLVAACAVGAIKIDEAVRMRAPLSLEALFSGIGFIRGKPVILGALSLDLFAVLLGGATALLPVFARDIFDAGPWVLGLSRAAPAVGALAVSVWLTRAPIERGVGRKMLLAVGVYGLSMLAFGWSKSFALSFAALLVSGAADMVSVVIRQTLVQLDTPDAMRGRVAAANSIFIGASNQLGEFESGATAAAFGPVGSVVLGGFGTLLVVALWFRFFPALARRETLATPQH
jgi:MFS family permease